MPKKCPAIDSSTPHKKQPSDDKPSKKHSRKSTESCRSAKLSQRHSTAKYQSPRACPINAPSSWSKENNLAINCLHPTSAESVQFSCNCSSSKKRKTLGRQCSAGSPTIHCPGSYDKACKLNKSKSSTVRNECCCGVPRKKENLEKSVKVQKSGTIRNKPLKDCIKPPKDPKPCKAAKEPKPRKVVLKDRKISEHKEEAKTFEQLVRPCNCCETRIEPDRKKSRGCSSNLFCCLCFNKLWNKKRNKNKKDTNAPCKRYLCLHNPGRSDCDESIPCVKCTHNCNERWLEKSGKESAAKSTEMCPESSSKTLASSQSTKTICEASDTGRHEAVKSREIKTKEKCRSYKAEGISEERSLRREKKREEKCKRQSVRESKKRKSCKHSKKPKRVAYDIPESTVACASAPITVENKCCPCKIPEEEVKLKTKPCMKCPNNIAIGKKSSCKKLTFASCTDLRDYKIENQIKKRSAMGIIFDVIFWPYAFWPCRDPCK